ncbi:MAG: glycosyltransferase family 4 protein [Pseudomonadota bacterium]
MQVLVVAPQPFYEERGTPIAVRQMCQTLVTLGHTVDLLTYHVGQDVDLPGITHIRIRSLGWITSVPIGFSMKKIVCDLFVATKLRQLLRLKQYDVVHAVEEAVFPARWLTRNTSTRVVYDMDSLLSDQLANANRLFALGAPSLRAAENWAIRQSDLVVAVCDALADAALAQKQADRVFLLPDTPLETDQQPTEEQLRTYLAKDEALCLYVGNLERYQGVQRLIEALPLLDSETRAHVLIIGGNDGDIADTRALIDSLGCKHRVTLLGPRPVQQLQSYLEQADILLSPRLTGGNTPMKIYSYMAAGKPILATRISSHTQVLDSTSSELVNTDAAAMASGLTRLVHDDQLRSTLAANAKQKVEAEYSLSRFKERLAAIYDRLAALRVAGG